MSTRKQRPYDPFKGTFYLIGHCHMRDEARIFALDRITLLHQTKESFEIPEGFNLEEFTGTSFGVFQGPLTKVKVWFSPEIAGYVKEKVWHESQKIHEEKDGSVIFEAVVAGTDEIRFWVMSWGSHAEVLEPEALREKILQEAEQVSGIYGSSAVRRKSI